MRSVLIVFFLISFSLLKAQNVSIAPTISPALFQYNTSITVTYDVTGTSLSNLSDAWIWVWIPGATSINAKHNINPATSGIAPAKFTKSTVNGRILFSLSFIPADFFVQDISAQTSMGMLLKASAWSGGQTIDYIATFGFSLKLNSPIQNPFFVSNNEQFLISASVPSSSDFNLYKDDVLINTQSSVTGYSYVYTVTEETGSKELRLEATSAFGSDEVSFQYVVSTESPLVTLPTGIIPGINYNLSDNTKATLCLWAPGKTTVHTRGEFTDWELSLMNRDGEFFWIEVSGLTPQLEYAFQYLVDETIWIADPYSDKILDPDDQYIPDLVYPNLKDFPSQAINSKWYFNRLSVLQTGQPAYNWIVTNFAKPAKEKLVIYELLIRDFFATGSNTYATLVDTISYFKRLGINAIELMPIMEFGGNNSWGYNPQFMFAPDKAYGPKNKLKEFIDVCHQNGIAVILDIALNHQDLPNPYLMMDFDFVNSKPTAINKWFNVSATHPFNVFFDMNHESTYTKTYLDTVNHYWLNEYKVDGFRFDLSKGFTQVNNPGNVSAWSAYDASRIAILKRMADKIWSHTPEAFVILEHLSVNSEEKELAEYRAGEGKGMMLWGNMNYAYRQNAMGYAPDSDISGASHQSRSWSVPHLISYMESHDEERMVFSNVTGGNSAGTYNTRQLPTALDRVKAAATIFYTVPGPKMLWQFGELGYDYSINNCEDGTIKDECRTYPKPIVWNYQNNTDREELFDHVSDLIQLRNTYNVFHSGVATISGGSTLSKQMILRNSPYTENPTTTDEMNAVIVANFEVTKKLTTITFPHEGRWYNHYEQSQIQFNGLTLSIELNPGEFRIYTDVPIGFEVVTDVEESISAAVEVYPNPVQQLLTVNSALFITDMRLYNLQGKTFTPTRISEKSWDVSNLNRGLFIAEFKTNQGIIKTKILIN